MVTGINGGGPEMCEIEWNTTDKNDRYFYFYRHTMYKRVLWRMSYCI